MGTSKNYRIARYEKPLLYTGLKSTPPSKGGFFDLPIYYMKYIGGNSKGGIPVDIQLCASATPPETKWVLGRLLRATRFPWWKADKWRSQVSFLSDEPEKDLRQLGAWIESRGYKPLIRAFSDKEFFLDLPGVFVNFLVEAMTPDCADYDVP